MKCIVLILILLLFSFQSVISQVPKTKSTLSQNEMFDHYISKSKTQKKTGFILLGVGVTAVLSGAAILTSVGGVSANGVHIQGESAGTFLFAIGSVLTIGSIPILISSGVNKRKATVILGSENVGFIGNPYFNTKYVSIGLTIRI